MEHRRVCVCARVRCVELLCEEGCGFQLCVIRSEVVLHEHQVIRVLEVCYSCIRHLETTYAP